MRQLIQDLRSGALDVVDLPDPVPGRNEVLVRTSWSLISPGTEQSVARTAGRSLAGKALERPEQLRKVVDKAVKDGPGSALAAVRARLDDVLTPGYSSMGIIEALGSGVGGLTVGEHVGCVGANAACHAERVVVPAPLTFPLPGGLDDRWGAFGALGGVAAHGVRVAEVDAGAIVAVVGLGLVGQLASQLVTAAGARAVAIDLDPERVALARRLGAADGAVLGRDDPEAAVRALTAGNGADAVVIAAATKESGPVELAAGLARDRATVSVVGDVGLDIPRAPFFEKELQLRVSRSYGPGRYDDQYERLGRDYPIGYVRWTERRLIAYFFEEVAAGRVRLDDLVTHEFDIGDATEAYGALSGDAGRLAILLRYGEDPPEPRRRSSTRVSAAGRDGRLRVGLVGPGLFARSTLLPELARADAELVAVVGRSPARAFGVARRWGAAATATDPAEVIDDPSIDVVVIATRHDSHADLAARALEAGKAVFVEKPLAIEDAEVARLEPLLEAGGRLVVGFNRSVASATAEVATHFSSRSDPLHVGYRVNAGYLKPGHWLRDPAQGGGRLVGEGCHFADWCSRLIDRPLISLRIQPLGGGPMTLEADSFVLELDYDDGSVATISYLSAGHAGLGKERAEVIGAARSAVIEDFRRSSLFPGDGALSLPTLRRQDKGHGTLLRRALEFFRVGGPPPIPYERLLETTRATLVARHAMTSGERGAVELSSL